MVLKTENTKGRVKLKNQIAGESDNWNRSIETATFGAGCFWCVEAIFQQLKGVLMVIPGYAGGILKNPSYLKICEGKTGHAEVCQILFDPKIITYDELLEVFWLIHDPTSLNKQGNDIGSQYRSVIYYHSEKQKHFAEEFKQMIESSGSYLRPIITEITSFDEFYKAEEYHMNYYHSHEKAPYCSVEIGPKISKFRIVFKDKLKVSGFLD